jgi:hypothetical protein
MFPRFQHPVDDSSVGRAVRDLFSNIVFREKDTWILGQIHRKTFFWIALFSDDQYNLDSTNQDM